MKYNGIMEKPEKSDPTKDPKFKRVVEHFLKTPPQPHKDSGKREKSPANGKSKKQKTAN